MPTRSSRLVILFACAGHAMVHVLTALFLTIVLVLEEAWQRPYDELIALWTAGALLMGLGAPLAGWLGDRWGETRVMIAFLIGAGAATIAAGLAEGPPTLWVALALLGLFASVYHPVGTAWVVKNAVARGRTIAIVGICGSLGFAVTALIAGLLSDLVSWRVAFALPGGLSVLLGLLLWRCYARGLVEDRAADLRAEAEPSRTALLRAFGVLTVTLFLSSVVYHAYTTIVPKWVSEGLGPSIGEGVLGIGAVVTLIYLVASMAQLVGGHASDRWSAKWAYVLSYAIKLPALLLAAYLVGWPIVAAAVVIAFMFDIGAPAENVLIARYAPAAKRGLVYGLRNAAALVAAPLGVQLVAWSYAWFEGYRSLFPLLAALVLVIVAVALLLPRDRPLLAATPAPTP
jgi:MFS family permease